MKRKRGWHLRTHGMTGTPEYRAFRHMIERCCSPTCKAWPYYGGRGIRVCSEWRARGGFERFLSHIGRRPSPGHELDRIDNNGHYQPGNVRWATRAQQMRNTRATVNLTLDGQTQCLEDWAKQLGVNPACLQYRFQSGWSLRDALTLPSTPHAQRRWKDKPKRIAKPRLTHAERHRNRSDNIMLTFQGETLCLADWADKLGIKRPRLYARIHAGWPVERALTVACLRGAQTLATETALTFGDTTMSIVQWSQRTGINHQTIRRRLRDGWSISATLTTPPRTQPMAEATC